MDSHQAIIMGQVMGVRYYFEEHTLRGESPTIREYTVRIKDQELWEGELAGEPLKVGECLLVKRQSQDSQDVEVIIDSVTRDTDGVYAYYTNHVIETITDETTMASRRQA